MKKIFVYIVASLLLVATGGFYPNVKTPPGTTFVKKVGCYVDKTVMTVADWKEFVYYIKEKEGENAASTYLPDTNVLIQVYGKNIFSSFNKKERKLPITGVSVEQIQAYCRFRTAAVREKFGTNVIYSPLDTETYIVVKEAKKLFLSGALLPEVIFDKNGTFHLVKNGEFSSFIDDNQPYTFRCIANYKK